MARNTQPRHAPRNRVMLYSHDGQRSRSRQHQQAVAHRAVERAGVDPRRGSERTRREHAGEPVPPGIERRRRHPLVIVAELDLDRPQADDNDRQPDQWSASAQQLRHRTTAARFVCRPEQCRDGNRRERRLLVAEESYRERAAVQRGIDPVGRAPIPECGKCGDRDEEHRGHGVGCGCPPDRGRRDHRTECEQGHEQRRPRLGRSDEPHDAIQDPRGRHQHCAEQQLWRSPIEWPSAEDDPIEQTMHRRKVAEDIEAQVVEGESPVVRQPEVLQVVAEEP